MQRICPVCNGLSQLDAVCHRCQSDMEDRGQLESYYGPYAPYEEDELLSTSTITPYETSCPHVAYCTECGAVERIQVPIVTWSDMDQG